MSRERLLEQQWRCFIFIILLDFVSQESASRETGVFRRNQFKGGPQGDGAIPSSPRCPDRCGAQEFKG
jgi:hypothetical protein